MRKERKTNANAGAERPDQKLMDSADEGTERDLMPPLSYSIDDVCRLTGLGRTTINEAKKSGALKARKCRRRTLILASDLDEWLRSLPRAQ
jgi:excisionase family DNA binding protein